MKKPRKKLSLKEQHAAIAERLQGKLLEELERRLNSGSINSTDLKTLSSILIHNGWTFDPAAFPKPLSDLVQFKPNDIAFDDDNEEDIRRSSLRQPLGLGHSSLEEEFE